MNTKNGNWHTGAYRIISMFLTVGVFCFAFVYGKELLANADMTGLQDRGYLLVLAFILFALSYVLSSWHWLRVCKTVNSTATNNIQMLSFFASQPYKYLPTSIFSFSYRAKFAKELGLSIKDSSVTQFIENINLIGASIGTATLFYITSNYFVYGLILTGVLCIVAILIYEQNVVIKIPKTNRNIHLRIIIPNFALMMCSWVVAGTAFLMVNFAFGLSVNPLLIISANAAAQAASILAVFAPGGIGVRELTLSLFAASNSAIVMWRMITFAADMLLGFGAVIVIGFVKKNNIRERLRAT